MIKLKRNDSLLASLTSSDFQTFNSSSMMRLNDLFKTFNGLSSNVNPSGIKIYLFEFDFIALYSMKFLDLPTLLGKVLCGPDFYLRLEDYGYTIKPITINMDEQNATTANTTQSPLKKKLNKKLSSSIKYKHL